MPPISEALAVAIQHHQGGRLEAAEQIYRQILQAEPKQADAMHLLGLIAYRTGKHELAGEYIRGAIGANGKVASFHYHLAKVYDALHRVPEAVACYRRAVELNPELTEAHNNLGNAFAELGKLDEAIACLRRATELKPDFPEAQNNLGNAFMRRKELGDAVVCYRRALALKPNFAEAQNNLGVALNEQGTDAEAEACFRRALQWNPAYGEAHNNLGNILREQRKLEAAIACFRRALELEPDLAKAHNNLGLAFQEQGKLTEAEACCRRALQLEPGLAKAHNILGVVFLEQGKLDEAIACFHRALALKPEYAKAHNNLGNALKEQGRLDEAVVCFRRALELEPGFAAAHSNLGNAFKDQRKLEEAMGSYRRAIELEPDLTEAHYNLGLYLLLLGRHEEGWREYEHRLARSPARRFLAKPRWNGEPAEGRTILIQSEQGFGDALQFIRYAPLVRQRSGAERVLVETQPALARLLTRNGGWDAEIVPVSDLEESSVSFDCQVPLLSLPLALGLFEPLRMGGAYIHADEELRRTWHERLGSAPAIRVGLVWAGNPMHKQDRHRSMPPAALRPLLQMAGYQFYSLQVVSLSGRPRVLENAGLIDLTASISDFADTAALVAELDLIISVDTAAAHLAGAMGRPVWTLLPYQPEWRWGFEGAETPWYPTMRLFRQDTVGDWDGVVRRVSANLRLGLNGIQCCQTD